MKATLYLGDCAEVMQRVESDSIDAVITDPPYGIAKGAAFVRRNCEEILEASGREWNALMEWDGWLFEARRILKPGGYLVTFHDMNEIELTMQRLRGAELEPWSRFWIVKSAPPPTPRPIFQSGIEEAVIAVKDGKRRWYGGGATPNYWRGLTPNRLNEAVHPSQKPDGAIARLISALTPEGGVVGDFFMGSGTTGVAALRLGRNFVGGELDEGHFATAERRIREDAPMFNVVEVIR